MLADLVEGSGTKGRVVLATVANVEERAVTVVVATVELVVASAAEVVGLTVVTAEVGITEGDDDFDSSSGTRQVSL